MTDHSGSALLRERLQKIRVVAKSRQAASSTGAFPSWDKHILRVQPVAVGMAVRTAAHSRPGRRIRGWCRPHRSGARWSRLERVSSGLAPIGQGRKRGGLGVSLAMRSPPRWVLPAVSSPFQPDPGASALPLSLLSSPLHASTSSLPVSSTGFTKRPVIVHGVAYSILNLLGKGGSSKVYHVFDEQRQQCYAMKCVDLSDADDSVREAYRNEIKLLRQLQNHSCIIRVIAYEERGGTLFVIMEKGDTDLATFLKTRRAMIDEKFIRFYWSEMLQCVQVIHSHGVVHSDLKPANFLLVGGNLKLIDFGIASAIPSNKTAITKDCQMGTLSYMSPEAIQCTENHGDGKFKVPLKSDVWSLGCILYNMVYGRTPFQAYVGQVQKICAIVNPNVPIAYPDVKDKRVVDVIKRCLVRDYKQRADVTELLNHPYLTQVAGSEKENTCEDENGDDEQFLMEMAEELGAGTPRTNARKLKQFSLRIKSGKKKEALAVAKGENEGVAGTMIRQ